MQFFETCREKKQLMILQFQTLIPLTFQFRSLSMKAVNGLFNKKISKLKICFFETFYFDQTGKSKRDQHQQDYIKHLPLETNESFYCNVLKH